MGFAQEALHGEEVLAMRDVHTFLQMFEDIPSDDNILRVREALGKYRDAWMMARAGR